MRLSARTERVQSCLPRSVAVAIWGASALHLLGWVDLGASVYQKPVLPWLSMLLGGAIFGVGMTLAGGCPNKNLVRLGGGSVRSLVVLVFVAMSAYMTLKGLFAQWRVSFLDPVAIDLAPLGLDRAGLAHLASKLLGVSLAVALAGVAAVAGLALLVFVFLDAGFRADSSGLAGGFALGGLTVAAWFLTGHLGYGENPDTLETVYFATNSRTIESFSFVAPTAYSLEMLLLWTDKSLRMTFGIASIVGVACGALAVALVTRSFRWEGFASLADLRANLIGATLMGFGGVTATGCTIGQGLSGLSTLSLGSIIAVTGIVVGSVVTNKWLAR